MPTAPEFLFRTLPRTCAGLGARLPKPEYRLAIVGDPVAHSLSPAMHEAALRECGLDGWYERIRVSKSQLGALVGQLRRKGYTGFNVTIPHKESILPLLPSVDPAARRIG